MLIQLRNAGWWFVKVARHVIGRRFSLVAKETRLRNEFNFSCETDRNACFCDPFGASFRVVRHVTRVLFSHLCQ